MGNIRVDFVCQIFNRVSPCEDDDVLKIGILILFFVENTKKKTRQHKIHLRDTNDVSYSLFRYKKKIKITIFKLLLGQQAMEQQTRRATTTTTMMTTNYNDGKQREMRRYFNVILF